jgi:hypothetical protein
VAAVFKIAGQDLSKPIGKRKKSAIGIGFIDKEKVKIPGILFDRN